jgi:hypothetical protein
LRIGQEIFASTDTQIATKSTVCLLGIRVDDLPVQMLFQMRDILSCRTRYWGDSKIIPLPVGARLTLLPLQMPSNLTFLVWQKIPTEELKGM